MKKELLQEAIETYGKDIVNEVIMMVDIADPDGVYITYEDMGMFRHSECVEFLYFN